jgi:hypothetical protein
MATIQSKVQAEQVQAAHSEASKVARGTRWSKYFVKYEGPRGLTCCVWYDPDQARFHFDRSLGVELVDLITKIDRLIDKASWTLHGRVSVRKFLCNHLKAVMQVHEGMKKSNGANAVEKKNLE